MIARAFGPGSAVLISGIVVIIRLRRRVSDLAASFPLPPRARRTVLEQDPAPGQIVADPIGRGEITPPPRRLTILDQALDLVDRDRRLRLLGPMQRDHANHPV